MCWKSMVLLSGLWLLEPTEPVSPNTPVATAVNDQNTLADDLKSLEHAEFRVREAAARRLVSRRVTVVAPLAELAQTGSAEASVRAFELLRQLHRDGDDEIYEAVEATYEALVQSENILAASRAEAAIEAVSEVRHRRALASFRKLGGLVQFESEEDTTDEDATPPPIHAVMINQQWKGGDDGLKYLRRIEDFRTAIQFRPRSGIYFIRGAKVSTEALDGLRAAFGGAVVERGPACLGVMQQQGVGEEVVRIDQVVPDSAAGRAGLQQDDIVLEFDDVPIPNFKTLVEKIGDRQPGDKIRILYSRDGEKRTTTAELLEWTLTPVLKRAKF
jgi:hypothetical protein